MRKFERVGDYHALWGWLVLSAPDNFRSFDGQPVDQLAMLREAFSDIQNGFRFVRQRVKDERLLRILEEMIELSLEAYLAGDKKRGAHALQECEAIVWKKKGWLKPKYVVEAELRAFGTLELFKAVQVSIYPFEGTADDLSSNQRKLLDHAHAQCIVCINEYREFKWFSWVIDSDDRVRRISIEPKGDIHSPLDPLQKSQRAVYMRTKILAKDGLIKSSVLVSALSPLGGGLLSFTLEDKGRPRIEAVQTMTINDNGVREFSDMRYHLNDPDVFGDEVGLESHRVS